MTAAIAHVKQKPDGTWSIHTLEEHLKSVAELSAEFARPFGNDDWAYLMGLWHDLGKYSAEFQSYIRSASGFDPDAHLEGSKGRVDHSTAGAIHALEKIGDKGRLLAYAIAGHHAGLGDWLNTEVGRSQVSERVKNHDLLERVLKAEPPSEILNAQLPSSKPPAGLSREDTALWIRMLFSCLVDADFLDTEEFMNANLSAERANNIELSTLRSVLRQHFTSVIDAAPATAVNNIRQEVRKECLDAAVKSPGIFRLTVPTGGGKTLSSMAFALEHAVKYQKRRIIYAIPYTSIVEQTCNVFRNIFGHEAVLEHHSNFDPDMETAKSRLACENWDAPIVVTTNVQLFESLFASRTSRTRKLHRIVESVIVLDEAQLIPTDFFQPILDAINALSNAFGVTFVLSTATQPSLEMQEDASPFRGLAKIQDIVSDPVALYSKLQRVEVKMPLDINTPISPHRLAEELLQHDRVLCILNRKDECRELFELMPADTFHLSGYMCGQHRSEIIAAIKNRLMQGLPIRVISTQLVEAGVDLDFPVVYRAFCGLDSLAQAAGRCNREGKLPMGTVHVFVSWKKTPRGHLRHMEAAFREVLHSVCITSLLEPESFDHYFRHLYWIKGKEGLDTKHICRELLPDSTLSINFRTASLNFKLIDDNLQKNIFVRFQDGSQLIETLRKNGPERWLLRKLQRFSISIPTYIFTELVRKAEIEEVQPGFFAQSFDGLYHPKIGFLGSGEVIMDPDDLIV